MFHAPSPCPMTSRCAAGRDTSRCVAPGHGLGLKQRDTVYVTIVRTVATTTVVIGVVVLITIKMTLTVAMVVLVKMRVRIVMILFLMRIVDL